MYQTRSEIDPWVRHRGAAFGVLCLALAVVVLDDTVLNIAIPSIYRELHASDAAIQWALSGYILTYSVTLLPAGNLGDRYGRRTFLIAGLVVFGVASVGAAFAPSAWWLVGLRAIQGVGGGMVMPPTLSILIEITPSAQRAKAVALWTTVSGVAIMLGPLLAGVLVAHFWWGSVFLVNAPLVVVAVAGSYRCLPNHRDRDAVAADLPGTLRVSAALSGLLFAAIELPVLGPGSPAIWVAAGVSVAGAVSYVRYESRTEHPLLDLSYVRQWDIAIPCIVAAVLFGTSLGTGYLYTQYLQILQGRTALNAAVVTMTFIAGWVIGSQLSPGVVRRIGFSHTLVAGLVAWGATFVALLWIGDNHGVWVMVAAYGVQGVAMSTAVTPATEHVMSFTPSERYGIGSSLGDLSRQLPGAVGVALLGSVSTAVFAWSTRHQGFAHVSDIASGVVSENPMIVHAAHIGYLHALYAVATVSAVVSFTAAAVVYWTARRRRPAPVPSGVVDELEDAFSATDAGVFAARIGCGTGHG